MSWRDQKPVTDEDLVAYLDGQLDAERAEFVEREVKLDHALENQLELMREGGRPFAEAFDLLLKEAPDRRLQDICDLALNPPPPPVEEPDPDPEFEEITQAPPRSRPRVSSTGSWGWGQMLAAAVVLLAVFAGGLYAGRYIQLPGLTQVAQAPAEQRGWRAAVADYQALFVKATLEEAGLDPATQAANLRAALTHVGLDLSVSKVSVAPLDFKRAEVLNFKGKPLVQMAYLYEGETPVSFCIIRTTKPAHGVKAEQRQGLNIAHWQNGEYGFMVIGDVPQSSLNDIAAQLKQRLS